MKADGKAIQEKIFIQVVGSDWLVGWHVGSGHEIFDEAGSFGKCCQAKRNLNKAETSAQRCY